MKRNTAMTSWLGLMTPKVAPISTEAEASLRRASRASGCADAELVEHADDGACAARPCARRRSSAIAAISGSRPARSRPDRSPRTPARAPGRPRAASCAARPSAANEPATLASSVQRLLAVARGGAQARVRDRGVGAAGLELQRAAQVGLAALGHQRVGLGRHDPVEEALDLRRRQRADELVDDLAVLERLHGRDRLDAEGLREPRVGVGVDLHELDLPVALVDGLLDHGPERAARTAPLGPEVDDHGLLVGALDDVALEGRFGGVDGHAARIEPMDLRIDADGVTLSGEEDGRGRRRSCSCTG